MESSTTIATMFLKIVSAVTDMNKNVSIAMKVGEDISLEFNSFKFEEEITRRRLSPSQIKRNNSRKVEYIRKKFKEESATAEHAVLVPVKMTEVETQTDWEQQDKEMQTGIIVDSVSVGTITEEVKTDTVEDMLEIDDKGVIRPHENEVLVEMGFSHNTKSWEDVENYIETNLKLTLLGKPWLSNNGKHYMTVGFRTRRQEFENWKMRTLNWQDSGVRGVTTSRMYR